MSKRNIIIISSLVVAVLLVFAGIYYYQATHFNKHVTINNTKVGGLTANQALKKLKSAVSKNVVYVGEKRIYDGKDTKMGFTNKDLSEVKNLLKKQQTFFPSSKVKNYSLKPSQVDRDHQQTMEKKIKEKLLKMNKGLKVPKDAEAHLKKGKISISKSVNGKQYDIASLLKDYEKQSYNSEIHLNPLYIQPIKENSPIIKEEKKKLQELVQRTVNYKVQDKVYAFKASELIKNASVTKNMKYVIDKSGIEKKLDDINHSQSTLNKNYTFKTHSGSVISVKGESYGWAIDIGEEAKRIQEALEKGKKTILAYNVYGVGWNPNGVGYHTTTNHGIGNTYVEVSIKEQRIWVYKDGKLKVTTNVVTGRHDVHEDTPTGVWYIMYKQSPSILKGSEVGNSNYSIKVSYWAPFTNSGCGFHDASWRKNWAKDAYLKQGSGGCVNTPPSAMKTVYNNISQYEPVIIY
ncbi:L,D-transpeptidase family protein [Bacillus ginsengihumi]|uniref:ErfK/YbiS/YcfS/YnhG family protein n=1 Tax=Heyndrickxia ginsengihumi TaxID=363870 RepID=A0A0A6XWF5_9BACI|nr:L,D-transpeptidase family protein [Heyndrickxia ginsengihumi]KHD84467.1 ErfK/YbiS/YcfS/YnhG family protein [Heyndrickxia ginsengihumi]NEY21438.1 L,D-transpeptidase family protein [Heyndrickxia ginsengihumi]